MKIFLVISLGIALSLNINAQVLNRTDVNSGGINGILSNQVYYSYSLGGIATNTIAPSTTMLKVGFQQFDEIKTVNIVSHIKTEELQFYPNPSSNYIYIKNEAEKLDYTIYSTEGKPVLTNSLTQNNLIDVSSLASGVYYISVQSKNKIYQTQKIFITK